ncbi:Uncharacterised protein [Mycoplasmopsis maculosa]|uniref:Htpn n=1 Tax=Mycoplasmopsis maculosa TaxID=114885 RepID=A0A449B4R8_9BACT|nr:htpn [Mycoplasmopsis maculosa]VEU75601.1 Uncharacterised protein [Mycoplasmopsis maculosa]
MDINEKIKLFNKTNEKIERLTTDYPKQNKIKFNSFEQFTKYGLMNTITTLWSKFPKIYDTKNDLIKFNNKINILINLQKLESFLYTDGVAALRNDFNVGQVLDFIETNNELTYLKVKLFFESKSYNFQIIEEYKLTNFKVDFKYEIVNDLRNKLSENEIEQIIFKDFNYKPKLVTKIPYQLFKNLFNCIPDLKNVNKEWFKMLDDDLKLLSRDSFISAPWIFSSGNGDIKRLVQQGYDDVDERFIKLNSLNNLYNNQDLIRLYQGLPQSPVLIQKIDKTIALIKKFGFMKSDTSDLGTKNIHSVEAEQINSDFEDFIEMKANIRELQLLEFFEKFYSNLSIENIIITGSTAWLHEQAKILTTDQNGTIINNNPPEINEIEEEKVKI